MSTYIITVNWRHEYRGIWQMKGNAWHPSDWIATLSNSLQIKCLQSICVNPVFISKWAAVGCCTTACRAKRCDMAQAIPPIVKWLSKCNRRPSLWTMVKAPLRRACRARSKALSSTICDTALLRKVSSFPSTASMRRICCAKRGLVNSSFSNNCSLGDTKSWHKGVQVH